MRIALKNCAQAKLRIYQAKCVSKVVKFIKMENEGWARCSGCGLDTSLNLFTGKCGNCGKKMIEETAVFWCMVVGLICFGLFWNTFYKDSDEDGLTDRDEVNIYGTNPALADTDGDGFTDKAEIYTLKTDPLEP